MFIYVVQPGDSLTRIASNYRVKVTDIISANGLPNPDNLVIGQAIIIPTEDSFYTVQPGDSLWAIAQRYGTTVNNIIQANQNINPYNIYPGLVLFIPAPRHVVMSGETLLQIAQQYGVSLQTLMQVNKIQNPESINAGTVLVIPVRQRPEIETNGFIYVFGQDAVPIVNEDGPLLTYLAPFAYLIKEDGSLQTIDDSAGINAAYSQKVVPMMAVTNFTTTSTGGNVAHIVLSNPTNVNTLLNNIISTMKQKGYQGVNIDFENVLPEDRESYNSFLQVAADRLHAEHYFLSTSLAPKLSATQRGTLYEAHDYPAHGRIVDFVVLMTYEWGCRKCAPQAISPIDQIRGVLDYAVTVIPRNKILMGFQIYARDWTLPFVEGGSQEAETISCQEAIVRAAAHNTIIQYDTTAQSPFYYYTDSQGRAHVVWFEDARSAQAKFDTAKMYGLRGISYWALGYPFPQNWTLLGDNFTIRKLI